MHRFPIYTAIFVTIAVSPSLMDPINLPKLWLLTLGSGLTFTLFFNQIWHSRLENNKKIFFLSGTFAITLLLTAIASNQNTYKTVIGTWGRNNGALTYFSLLVLFLTLATMKSLDPSRFLVNSLSVLGVIAGLYGLMQNSGADFITWENAGNKIILTLGNSDFASAFLALTGVATLSLILRVKLSRFSRLGFLISYLVQIYLIKKSDAIQGLIVLLLGSAILIGLHLTLNSQKIFKQLAAAWWGLLAFAGGISILGLNGHGPLSGFLNPNLNSFKDRYYHWVAGIKMLQNHLFFGVGIDSFGDYYRKYRVIEAITLRGNASSGTNNAHNTIVQIGATGGLVLLIPYLLLICFTAYRGFIALKNSKDKLLTSGVFSIWVAFQVQSLVSIDQIGLVVWGWASAGCLIAISYYEENNQLPKSPKEINKKRNPQSETLFSKWTTVVAGISILPTVLLSPMIFGEYAFRNKIVALVNSNTDDSLMLNSSELFSDAIHIKNPELRLYALQYLLQTKNKDLSLKLAKSTVSEFPNSFEAWDALARIYETDGDRENAVSARKRSIFLDPLNEDLKKLLTNDLASN